MQLIEFFLGMKLKLLSIALLFCGVLFSQNWQFFIDSIPTLSSPRACDLTNDGIKDIVFGGGTDGVYSNNGIMAVNGANGALLWKRATRNEVFGSAVFQDITNDGIKDVFMVGRQAQLLAINGANGTLLWDFFPYNNINPADSGLYNFYNPQFIADVSGDGLMDLLVANGGDHAAPVWDTTRPPGHLMVVNSLNGHVIAKAVVPDSAETYCSPLVADIQGNGVQWVLYGTGGETLGGSFWACPLSDLLNNTLAPSIQLAHDPNLGFVAPASIYKTNNNQYNIFIQSYGGKLIKIKGSNLSAHWNYQLPNTESSAEPVIGNFTGNNSPDVFLSLAKGQSSGYTDYYQVLLDGASGNVVMKDSIGHLQFASGNAIDLNQDGRDEAILAVNYMENGYWKHRLQSFDFVNNTIQEIVPVHAGTNIGSTPLFTNLDNDNTIDLVYLVKKDSLNVMGWKGVYAFRTELNSSYPNAGLAWGSYLGTLNNGEYHNTSIDCGVGSILSGVTVTQPWCNGTASGAIIPSATLGTGPYTYLWSNGSSAPQLNNLAAGTYMLQVTDAAGCYETYTAYLTDPYAISFGGIYPPTCPGGTNGQAIVNSSGCPCMFSTCVFLWENGITTKPNNTLAEGWATITITHPNGCVVVDSVLVPNAAPIISQAVLNDVTCNGNNDGMIHVYPGGPAPINYSWSNGSTSDSLGSLSPGTYVLTVSDARPCYDTLSYTINEPQLLGLTAQVTPPSCWNSQDGQLNLLATGGVGGYTYTSNGVGSSAIIQGLSAGSYSLVVSDSNNCSSTPQIVQIQAPSMLNLSISITPESAPNALDGMATAHVTGGTAPYTFLWSDPNQQSDSLAVYLTQGWYNVTVTDDNGCEISDSVYMGILENDETKLTNLWIYPVPASQWIHINQQVEHWVIYDATGRILDSGESMDIKVHDLPDALYLIDCQIQGQLHRLRFIKTGFEE